MQILITKTWRRLIEKKRHVTVKCNSNGWIHGQVVQYVSAYGIFLSIHILSKKKSKVLMVPLCSFRLFEWLCFGTRLSLFRICPVAVSQSGHRYRLNFHTALNIGNHKRCDKSNALNLNFPWYKKLIHWERAWYMSKSIMHSTHAFV